MSYLQADLAGGATFNPKMWALPSPVLKEAHWILHAENAQQRRQQTLQPDTLQERQAKEVLKHTRLYHKRLVLEATSVCVNWGS